MSETRPGCGNCGRTAVCKGAESGMVGDEYACNRCCDHEQSDTQYCRALPTRLSLAICDISPGDIRVYRDASAHMHVDVCHADGRELHALLDAALYSDDAPHVMSEQENEPRCAVEGTCCGHVAHRQAEHAACVEYFRLLDAGDFSDNAKARMDALMEPYYENTAMIAFLERKRMIAKAKPYVDVQNAVADLRKKAVLAMHVGMVTAEQVSGALRDAADMLEAVGKEAAILREQRNTAEDKLRGTP